MTNGYIYLIQPMYYKSRSKWERNLSIYIPDNVYKVGKTSQIPVTKRLSQYGYYKTIYIETINSESVNGHFAVYPDNVETRCIDYFKENFKQWCYGKEYFIISDIERAKQLINISYKDEIRRIEDMDIKLENKLKIERETREYIKKIKQNITIDYKKKEQTQETIQA